MRLGFRHDFDFVSLSFYVLPVCQSERRSVFWFVRVPYRLDCAWRMCYHVPFHIVGKHVIRGPKASHFASVGDRPLPS
jgi:hypothetical protein